MYDNDVGYTQGMNFIAALILLYVEEDALAWLIFVKVLQIDNWRQLFLVQTPKLFDLSDEIRIYLEEHVPIVHNAIKKYNVVLESLFASAFMTLFSNLVSIE
jgi:hypothetical protein